MGTEIVSHATPVVDFRFKASVALNKGDEAGGWGVADDGKWPGLQAAKRYYNVCAVSETAAQRSTL